MFSSSWNAPSPFLTLCSWHRKCRYGHLTLCSRDEPHATVGLAATVVGFEDPGSLTVLTGHAGQSSGSLVALSSLAAGRRPEVLGFPVVSSCVPGASGMQGLCSFLPRKKALARKAGGKRQAQYLFLWHPVLHRHVFYSTPHILEGFSIFFVMYNILMFYLVSLYML